MATSGLVAVDVVVRERESVAGIPSVVRAIRQFADTPVVNKLKRAMAALASATELDELLSLQSEDMRIEALEGGSDSVAHRERLPLSRKGESLVSDIFVYGAKRGSARVVQWALSTTKSIRVNGALRAAVNNGQFTVVQLLYPKVWHFSLGFTEDALWNLAAARGNLEILEWMYANRRDRAALCSFVASENAAMFGHLDILKWLLTKFPDQWSSLVLEEAAFHGQQHVVDWIFKKRLQTRVSTAMESLVHKGARDGLLWLHDKSSESRLYLSTLKKMASGSQLELAVKIVTCYPKSYEAYGIAIGVICEDLELVKKLAADRKKKLKRREVKSAMCLAASYGHLEIVQWLSTLFADCIPTKALWSAIRCGHVDVLCWLLEQKPELRSPKRMSGMFATSLKQSKKLRGARSKDMQEMTAWLEEQQKQLSLPAFSEDETKYLT